jgi:hypothetical protein
VVTRLGMDDWEIVAQFRAGARSFCVECAEWVWGPLVLLWISTGCSSPGVKRPECEANRSPSSSVEVNSDWNYTSVPPFVFMTCYGSISSLSHVIFFRFYDTRIGPDLLVHNVTFPGAKRLRVHFEKCARKHVGCFGMYF